MSEPLFGSMQKDAYVAGKETARTILHEFLVDLLGVFLPGIIFTAVGGFWVAAAITLAYCVVYSPDLSAPIFEQYSAGLTVIVVVLFFALAYVTGHFFFRRGPKEPDFKSALRISSRHRRNMKEKAAAAEEYPFPVKVPCLDQGRRYECRKKQRNEETGRGNIVYRLRPLLWLRCEWRIARRKCPARDDVQFPYHYLKEYLTQRELFHLADLVPWSAKDSNARSKIFLNILKVRLQATLPGWCHLLTRNEAHVRLMSSTWFMAKALLRLGGALLILSLIALVVVKHVGPVSFQEWLGPLILFSCGTFLLILAAFWVMRTIEDFLLYQRIREVTQVLETAYYAALLRPELGILAGLYEGNEENKALIEPEWVLKARDLRRAASKKESRGKS